MKMPCNISSMCIWTVWQARRLFFKAHLFQSGSSPVRLFRRQECFFPRTFFSRVILPPLVFQNQEMLLCLSIHWVQTKWKRKWGGQKWSWKKWEERKSMKSSFFPRNMLNMNIKLCQQQCLNAETLEERTARFVMFFWCQ